mmetsp:Transcript_79031/g.211192  ORF Transcript_79031/g.211192 Transcript_79031/m.211192 type:complete len:157 (+) Transcript_79031:132-602(+)
MPLVSTLRWADEDDWVELPSGEFVMPATVLEGNQGVELPAVAALFGFEEGVPEAIGCQSDGGVSSVGDSVESRSSEGGYRCMHGQKICGHAAKCHCDAEQLRVYCHNAACREAKKEAQKEKRKRRSAARAPSWRRRRAATGAPRLRRRQAAAAAAA